MAGRMPGMAEPAPSPYALTVPHQVTVATQPVVVHNYPAERPSFYETAGFAPAVAALLAVLVTYKSLQASTKKQIDAAAQRTSDEFEHATRQATAEREYSAQQAKEERLMEARREVYTELVDKFILTQNMFGNMMSVEVIADGFGSELRMFGGPVNKTWLLSGEDTAYRARELYTVLNEQWFRLLPLLTPINMERQAVETFKKQKLELQQRIRDLRREGEEFNGEELRDLTEHWRHTKESIVSHQRDLSEQLEDFTAVLLANQPTVMTHVNGLMLAARKEMGVEDGNYERLEEQSTQMTARVREAMATFHAELKSMERAEF